MKRLLLTFFLSVATLILFSQTVKTRLADPNTSWNNPSAWSPAGNPDNGDHIIIPAGVTLNINQGVSIGYIEAQSGSTVILASTMTFLEPSSIAEGATFNWTSGTISGGSTISNEGLLDLSSLSNKTISGSTSLINNSELRITSSGDLFITNGIVTNEEDGVIDLQVAGGNISFSGGSQHILNNHGILKRSSSDGECQIYIEMFNTGTITVESGTLSFLNGSNKNLVGGIYNVFEDAILDWDGTVNLEGTLSGNIAGVLNWNSIVNVPSEATLDLSGSGSFNWNSGSLQGGGVLTNMGTLDLTSNSNKIINQGTQLDNDGAINIISSGDLFITEGVFNNLSNGTLNMQGTSGNISWSGGITHVLNNSGLIKKTGAGESQIVVELINDNGTISVESGTLSFQNNIGKHLNQGVYNVFEGAVFDWDTRVSPIGLLTGTIDGTINWNSEVFISEDEQASFDFSGSGNVNWTNSTLHGGGVLVNLGTLNLIGNTNKIINQNTQLDNLGIINFNSSGDLFITNGIVNNLEDGIIDLRADAGNITWSGGSVHVLNNYGLIKRTATVGEVQIVVELYNYNTGIIEVETGILSFQNTIGKYLEGGTYNVSEGAVLDWDGTIFPVGTLSGSIDGTLNWNNVVIIPMEQSAAFAFSGEGSFNWTNLNLNGGGTLVNQSELNLTSNANKIINDNTVLNNEGIINVTSSGDLYITNGIVNNTSSGIIDLQTNAGNITWSGGSTHILNNFGIIKKTSSEGEAQIVVELTNSGTVSVESGVLSFTNGIGKYLQGGIYNVSEDAIFNWSGVIYPSGELVGSIDGTLNWNNVVNVPVNEEAKFSFEGSGTFNWVQSNLVGGGTLINNSDLNLGGNNNRFILDDTNLINESTIRITGNGDLLITQGVVTNSETGVFDLQTDNGVMTYSGGTTHLFINEGLLIKSGGAGTSTNFASIDNEGEIRILEGTLRFMEGFIGSGEVTGIGALQLNGTTEFSGTISPGLSPGTLGFQGNYISTSSARLELDLNGLAPDTEHDLFQINGNAELNGGVDINLGFIPQIGDEFIVLTSTGDITACNLPDTETVLSGINNFIFTITCENDNQVVLELVAIGGNGDYNMDGAITIVDLSGFLAEFGSVGEGLIGDFNGDGAVTSADLSSFLSVFGLVY
ncbi:MAG: beta strand repeat-containing protein [Flavobacteriales bacterium]